MINAPVNHNHIDHGPSQNTTKQHHRRQITLDQQMRNRPDFDPRQLWVAQAGGDPYHPGRAMDDRWI